VVIPETITYRNREFKPIEIPGVLIHDNTTISSLSVPQNISKLSSKAIVFSFLNNLIINTSITTDFLYGSNVDNLVITSSVINFITNLDTNTIGKLTIEDGVTTLNIVRITGLIKELNIGRYLSDKVFQGNTNLTKLNIGGNYSHIDVNDFSGCKALKELELDKNVTSIAAGAFKTATSLVTITSKNPIPPTTNDTFSNETYLDGVLYVPEGSEQAYASAPGWKNFWEIKSLNQKKEPKDIWLPW
jgi:hypothetical protein